MAGAQRVVSGGTLSIDAGLLARFRRAGDQIQWRDAPAGGRARGARVRVRIAHLNDEEARIETAERGTTASIVVESGPVGALVLLLEMDRRGDPVTLTALEAGARPGFGQGAIEGRWAATAARSPGGLPVKDLVELARYALA